MRRYAASEVMPDLPHELARDWYGLSTWMIIGACILFGIWAWWDRRAVRQRLADLEADVAELKRALEAEKGAHIKTQRLLAAALRHLRDLWAWIHGGHATAPPDIPKELREEL